MTEEMMRSILAHFRTIWTEWNVRGVILLSLSFQVLLIVVAPFRKATRKTLPLLVVWCSYLMADWAANYCIGLISDSQRGGGTSFHPKNPSQVDILAFWAPFLLLHLGGPDTITALALEDNELWLRHLLALLSQAACTLYVFSQSLPNNILWIPTVLMFVAGVIKYIERTRALYLASLDNFRNSMPNYAKMMEEYTSKKDAHLPMKIIYIPVPDEETKTSVELLKLNDIQVVLMAYKFFNTFKGLVVDLIFSYRERNESRDFFRRLDAETALRVIEVELNFIYEVMYTKVQVLQTMLGYSFRILASGAVFASLGYFYFRVPKSEFKYHGNRLDVGVTYALLLGAIALDFIALLMLVFSDWTLTKLGFDLDLTADQSEKPKEDSNQTSPVTSEPNEESRCKKVKQKFAEFYGCCCFLKMRKPWWRESRCHDEDGHVHVHQVLSTPILFRRWSGCVSGHNLIRFCLKGRPQPIHDFSGWTPVVIQKIKEVSGVALISKFLRFIYSSTIKITRVDKAVEFVEEKGAVLLRHAIKAISAKWEKMAKNRSTAWLFVVKNEVVKIVDYILHLPINLLDLLGLRETLDWFRYISSDRITRELWTFIFNELKQKSDFADDPEIAKRISGARGDWVLADTVMGIPDDKSREWMQYVTAVKYDESLLLWHIATELCYNYDKEPENGKSAGSPKIKAKASCLPLSHGAGTSNSCFPQKKEESDEMCNSFKMRDYREFSKMLSDYMMYLLVMQPTMMSSVAGIGKIRFRDTCAEAERFFIRKRLKPNDQWKACDHILKASRCEGR